jgi:hypothetical protein
MSKPIPDQSNFIAIGAWNPAIIQPQWLKKEFPTLIPEKFNVQIVAGVVSAFRIEFLDEFILDPNGGRLVFIPKKLDDKILKKIADLGRGIQNLLNHTPIAAAGCNFVFKLEPNEFFKLEKIETDEEIMGLYENIKDSNLISRSISHALSQEDHTINVTYDFKGQVKHLRINFDYQQPLNAMEVAANALIENFHRACNMCKELIGSK